MSSEAGIDLKMLAKQIGNGAYNKEPKRVGGPNENKKGDRPKKIKAPNQHNAASKDGTDAEITARTVYLSYMPMMMPHRVLMTHLEKFGRVVRVRICAGDPSKSKLNWVYGFAEYMSQKEAKACMNDGSIRFGKIMMHFTEAKSPISDMLPFDAECRAGKIIRKAAFYDPKLISHDATMQDVIAMLYKWPVDCEALKPGPNDADFRVSEDKIEYGLHVAKGDKKPGEPLIIKRSEPKKPEQPPAKGAKTTKDGKPATGLTKEEPVRSVLDDKGDKKMAKVRETLQTVMKSASLYAEKNVITQYFSTKKDIEELNAAVDKVRNQWTNMKLKATVVVIELALVVLVNDPQEISAKCEQVLQTIPPVALRNEVFLFDELQTLEGELVINEDLTTSLIPAASPEELETAATSAAKALEHETHLALCLVASGLLVEDVNPLAARCFFTMAQRRASVALDDLCPHLDEALSEGGFPLRSVKSGMFKILRHESYARYFFDSFEHHIKSVREQEAQGYSASLKLPPLHAVQAFTANTAKKM